MPVRESAAGRDGVDAAGPEQQQLRRLGHPPIKDVLRRSLPHGLPEAPDEMVLGQAAEARQRGVVQRFVEVLLDLPQRRHDRLVAFEELPAAPLRRRTQALEQPRDRQMHVPFRPGQRRQFVRSVSSISADQDSKDGSAPIEIGRSNTSRTTTAGSPSSSKWT